MSSGRGCLSFQLILALVLFLTGGALLTAADSPRVAAPVWITGAMPPAAQQRIERERYWFNRRGLQFGVPKGAYRRAVEQMRSMEAARLRATGRAHGALSPSDGAFNWHFIGPEPMTNAAPNFGGIIQGASHFDATGRISAIAADPITHGRLFVGAANGGVWMSTDDGATFVPIFDSQPTQAIGAIALDAVNTTPPTIYVATGEGNGADSYYGHGIFKSTDLGSTWIELSPGTFDNVAFTRLAIDTSKNPPTLFAAATGGASLGRADPIFPESDPARFGLWRSTDGGGSWAQSAPGTFGACASGAANCPADDVAVDPLNSGNVYVAIDATGVFSSTDGGNTFAPAAFPNPGSGGNVGRTSLAIGPPAQGAPQVCSGGALACGTLYAMVGASDGAEYAGFFRSTDGGATWGSGRVPTFVNVNAVGGTLLPVDGTQSFAFSQSNYDQALIVSPNDPATVFFGGVGLYESTDSGTTWAFIARGGGTHSDQHTLALGPDNDTVYVGNDGGAFKFSISAISNGTAAFTSLNDTLGVGQIQGIAPHPTNSARLIAGFQDNGTDVYTGSLNWVQVETADGGFTTYDRRNPAIAYHTFATQNGNIVSGGVSTNGGSSWLNFAIDFLQDTFAFYPPMASDPAVARRVLLGGNFTYVLNFTNDTIRLQNSPGVSFGCGDPRCALDDVEFVPSNHKKAWVLSAQQDSHPFRVFTTVQANLNFQAAWTEVSNKLPFTNRSSTQATGIAPDPKHQNTAYLSLSGFTAATGIGHVFRTTDFGSSWTQADGAGGSSPLPDVPVMRVLVDNTDSTGNTLYAGTDAGVFRSSDAGATWIPFNLGVIPAVPVFDIEQNGKGTIFVGTHGRGAYASVAPVGTPPPPAVLQAGPSKLTFGGEVFLNLLSVASQPKKVTLINPITGKQKRTIVISGISATGDFIAPPNTCLAALDPGARCLLPVAFAPTGPGTRSGQLTITSDATNSAITLPLSGAGAQAQLTVTPAKLNFGRVKFSKSSATKKVTVVNKNPAPIAITVSTVGFIGILSADFNLVSDKCSGTILGPNGGNCSILVNFIPLTKGPAATALVIGDNGGNSPHTVQLSGVGL